MAQSCLFIGGDADGKMIEVADVATVEFPAWNGIGCGRQQYRRETLAAGSRHYRVYVVSDIPGADVIGRLIAGYGVKRE